MSGKVDGGERQVDYVVQYRVRIAGGDRWGAWSVGEPVGRGRPDAAIRFVEDKRAREPDGNCQWRVVRVTREVIH